MLRHKLQVLTVGAVLFAATLICGSTATTAGGTPASGAPFTLKLPDGWQLTFANDRYQLLDGGASWSIVYYPPETAPSTLDELIFIQDAGLVALLPGTKLIKKIPVESKSAHMRTYRLATVPPKPNPFLVAGAILDRGAIGFSGSAPDDSTVAALRAILLSAKSR